jgi:NADPH-dependent 2,4-dienoyl-CoA reductase/sulfur reductase-like enzyme
MNKTLNTIKPKPNTNEVETIIYTEKIQLKNDNENKKEEKIENTMDTQMVILGTGVSPNTEILESVVTLENNFVKCDAYMSTSDKDIFTAGDITSYPSIYNGERISSLHYVNAQQQGAIAALNMLGKNVLYDYIPFFWVRFLDKSLHYVGYAESFDEVFIEGNPEEMSFMAYYIKNNKIVAFASMNKPNSANIIYESLRNNLIPSAKCIKAGELNLEKLKSVLKHIKPKCARAECVCANRMKI